MSTVEPVSDASQTPPAAATPTRDRLDALDGLRAVAALYVLLYHYTFCWTPAGRCDNLIAYGDKLAFIPFISVGFLGVQLFFVISGFVIFMTLERCGSIYEFLVRRAVRLWPPIFVFATFTFIFTHLIGPARLQVGFFEYLLSMLLLPPTHIGKIFGFNWSWVDYVYWTLFVELRFYIFAGVVYFWDRARFLQNWLVFEVSLIIVAALGAVAGSGAILRVTDLLIEPHIAFFSIGVAAYHAFTSRDGPWVRALLAVGLAHGALIVAGMIGPSTRQNVELVLVSSAIAAFAILYGWRFFRFSALEWEPLVYTGRISYGIYLVHQNLGLSLLSLPFFGWGYGLSVLGVAFCAGLAMLLAHLSFKYVEAPSQRYFRNKFLKQKYQPSMKSDGSVRLR